MYEEIPTNPPILVDKPVDDLGIAERTRFGRTIVPTPERLKQSPVNSLKYNKNCRFRGVVSPSRTRARGPQLPAFVAYSGV